MSMFVLAACSLLAGRAALRVHQPDNADGLLRRSLVREVASHGELPDGFGARAELGGRRPRCRDEAGEAPPCHPQDVLSLGVLPGATVPVPAEKVTAGSRFMLHMHFNWAEDYGSALWYVEQEICHPRNFMFCAFASDWSRESHEEPSPSATGALANITRSKHGVPVKFVDCEANGDGPSGAHGVFFYQCYSMSLQIAKDVGAEGVMFLADDTLLMTPWSTVMPYLHSLDTMILPFGRPSQAEAMTLNMKHFQAVDRWIVKEAQVTNFTNALETLSESQKQSLGFTESDMVVEKALGDAAYVPTRQADDFQALADHFYEYQVMEEWALPTIAHLLSGEAFRPQWPLKGMGVFKEGRKAVLATVEEEMNKGEVSFIHPVKISNDTNKEKVLEIYGRVFGP